MTSGRNRWIIVLASVVCAVSTGPLVGQADRAEMLLQQALTKELVEQDRAGAIAAYQQVLATPGVTTAVATRAKARVAALQSSSGAATGMNARRVWSGAGGMGALSPDGRFVASLIGATGDLGLTELATGTRRNLTNSGGWVVSGDYVEESMFSADGRQLAYTWVITNSADVQAELRIVATAAGASSAPRTVLRGRDYVAPVAWTPDGRRLIVKRQQDRAWQIGIVTIETGTYESLKSVEWRSPEGFSLSPDGRLLAYDMEAGTRGSARDVYLLAIDGSREITLAGDAANDTSALWSVDGSHVLFLSNRTGTTSLWAQRVVAGTPDGAPSLVKPDMDRATLLAVSRNGALYYEVQGASRQNVHVADLEANGLARRPTRPIGNPVNASQGPTWSRDGQYLAYYSAHNPTLVARPPASTLVVRAASTGVERVLPLPPTVENTPLSPGPKWFPDNRSVLILARDAEGTGRGLYRFDLDTAQTDLVWRVTQRTGAFFFDVSPDGRSIYVAFQVLEDASGGGGALVRYDIDTRQETVLRSGEWFIALAVSPDGTQLASLRTLRKDGADWPSVIEVMPTTGGTSREVFRHPRWYDGSRYNTLTWSSDQRFLIFGRVESGVEAPKQDLYRVPVVGGAPEMLGLSGQIKTPAVRPDGRQIAFGMRETEDNEIWMLENFLPTSEPRGN